MSRQLPPLNALRAFEAAGRHESFSRAAEELGVSHSAISKHVRGLEDRLGAQLFKDLPRGVTLSSEGWRLLSVLTPAFDSIAEAAEMFSDRQAGTIRVNSETAFALKWLVPNLPRFRERYPEIDIDLEATSQLVDISRYEADIAIRFVQSNVTGPDAALISDAVTRPVATPEIAAIINGDPEKILDFPLLRDRSQDLWGRWFAAAGRAELYNGQGAGRRLQAELAHEAAVSGLGVLLGSAENVASDLEGGRLALCSDVEVDQGAYFMMFGEGVLRRRHVRVFRDWLLDATQQFRE